MRALDTNVVVRLLVEDDPEQARRARALVAAGPTFLPRTVLLETEWVLRAAYRVPHDRLHAALVALVGLQGVVVEEEQQVLRALESHRAGLDFADALHHAASALAIEFATFDHDFVRLGAELGLDPPVREPG